MIRKIKSLLRFFGIEIQRYYHQRYAVMKAKEVFKDKGIVACEIGTSEGKHALQMLENLNIKKLYLIDPYENYEGWDEDDLSKKVDIAQIKAHNLLKQYSDKIVWIRKKSDEAIKEIKDRLDFIYIDGDRKSVV